MSRATDVIAIQGKQAAQFFAALCAKSRFSEMEKELERLREALTVVEERLSQIDCATIGMTHNTSQSELLDWCKGIASEGLSKIYAARRLVEGDGNG